MIMTFHADLRYSGDYYLNIVNYESFAQNDSFTVLGARVALGSVDGRWEVAAWGRNLTDEDIRTYGIYSLDNRDHLIYYGMPRSWGVTFRYWFQ
jgi:outer membrane receptor protein involved in Fe transport